MHNLALLKGRALAISNGAKKNKRTKEILVFLRL